MNPEHLAPMATVLEIEPYVLSVLENCDVSLDALNYLGKRLDGMDALERKQFLAALSCSEISEGWGLKNMINLTYNLARYTLIEDMDDLEQIGHPALHPYVFDIAKRLFEKGIMAGIMSNTMELPVPIEQAVKCISVFETRGF